MGKQQKVITLSTQEVHLHHTENAWKPNPIKATVNPDVTTAEEVI